MNESPLRLGIPDYGWLSPFEQLLQESAHTELTVAPVEMLRQALAEADLDAALIPPMIAFHHRACRVIPGWGFSLSRTSTAFSLRYAGQLDELKTLYPDPAALPYRSLIESILDTAGLESPPQPISTKASRLAPGEAYAALSFDDPVDIPEGATSLDLNSWWWEKYDSPLVLLLWQGRFRAPYPDLRRIIHSVFQRLEEVRSAPADEASGVYPAHLDCRLASAASEGLAQQLTLAKELGYAPEDASLDYC